MFTKFNKINTLNLIISLIPLSLIIGNSVTNLNIILVCILGYYIYGNEIFNIINQTYKKIIFLFFVLIIISTFFNNFTNLKLDDLYGKNLLKSVVFLRYLFFFLVINKCLEKKHFNYKLFFISSVFFSTILAIDIIFQVIFKKDLIGNPIYLNRPSGFFGEENIAGGYLQKFSLFAVFMIYLKYHKNKTYFFLTIIFFFTVIILTNNRMPLILFIFSIIFYLIIEKKIKEILLFLLTCSVIFITLLKYPLSERFNIQSKLFYKNTIDILRISPTLFYKNSYHEELRGTDKSYLLHFNTGVQTWKKNKIFGNGLKSFRLNCKYEKYYTCNNHPHNYFIQLMMDVGLIGLFLIYTFVILISRNFIIYYLSLSKKPFERKIVAPIFLIIFIEFFPVRSSGDFFSTNNAVVIFLFLALLLNIKNLKKFKLKKLLLL